jgi:2-polyprenyl-3-methyl-5-hydroxy-6-metoxy-1,4-benzoquinol methylase
LHSTKHSRHNSDDAITYHSGLSVSFKDKYNLIRRFKERKEIFVEKAISFVPRGTDILDLGCGPGVITSSLAAKGFRLTGVDGSLEMLMIARGKANSDCNVLFIQKKIPFNQGELNQQYDAVISSSLLEYLDDYDKTIIMVKELLKADGIFIASIPNKKSMYKKFERLIFRLIGKPLYLKYTKNHFTKEEFIFSVSDKGFVYLESEYFAIKGPLFRFLDLLLPPIWTNNMLICIFRKV